MRSLTSSIDRVTRSLNRSSNESTNDSQELMNAYTNKMIMGREVIADKGIWTAKKRYMLNVCDSEEIRYDTPKLKIMGIETTRSSTPMVVRTKLKEAISLVLSSDEETIQKFIDDFKQEFKSLPPEDVIFLAGVMVW